MPWPHSTRPLPVPRVAGAPGKGARVRIEGVEVAKLGVLGKAIAGVVHQR